MAIGYEQIIQKYQGSVPQRIVSAIESAAKKTGADFSLLMDKASQESDFNPAAKAKGSSATGLFQFIDSTWLSTVKEHGGKYGLGDLADKITLKNGKPCCTDADAKKKILDLRKNPEISALMAGELTQDNREYLEAHTKGDVGATETYLAHFMGAGGAAKFLSAREKSGSLAAASLFPREARANKSVFYDAQGKPRTLDQVYDRFAKKFEDGGSSVAVASNPSSTGTPSRSASPAPAPVDAIAQSTTLPLARTAPSAVTSMAQARPLHYMADQAQQAFFAPRLSSGMMLALLEMQHGNALT